LSERPTGAGHNERSVISYQENLNVKGALGRKGRNPRLANMHLWIKAGMTCASSRSLRGEGHQPPQARRRTDTVQVVIRPKYVCWDGRGEVAPVLIVVCAAILLRKG